MVKKTIISISMALAMLFGTSGTSIAAEPVYAETEQAVFEAQVASAYEANEMSDENVIETVINTFFDMNAKIYAGIQTLDNSFIMDDSIQYAACHDYFEEQARNMFSKEIYYPEYDVTVNAISIDGNTANVTAKFLFTYVYEPTETDRSGISVKYNFTLEKINGEWLIGDIQTNSSEDIAARECGYLTNNENVVANGIEAQIADEILSLQEMVVYEQAVMNSPSVMRASSISINRTRAASYASSYWSNYNSAFEDCTSKGGDCQNFASQCIWYGFGGTTSGIASHAFPMLTNWYGSKSGSSSSWISCTNFRGTALKTSGSSTGVYGIVWEMPRKTSAGDAYENYFSTLEVGDIIQFEWNDTGNKHAVVVTKVTGTAGSRTADNIYVSGHTTDEYNRLLSDKLQSNSNPKYWAIRIMSVYSA